MAGAFSKWLFAGVLAVGGGTGLAIAFAGAPLTDELTARAGKLPSHATRIRTAALLTASPAA